MMTSIMIWTIQLLYDFVFDKTLSAVAITICVFVTLYLNALSCPKIILSIINIIRKTT